MHALSFLYTGNSYKIFLKYDMLMFNISYLHLYLILAVFNTRKKIQHIKKKIHKIHSGVINFPGVYLRDIWPTFFNYSLHKLNLDYFIVIVIKSNYFLQSYEEKFVRSIVHIAIVRHENLCVSNIGTIINTVIDNWILQFTFRLINST